MSMVDLKKLFSRTDSQKSIDPEKKNIWVIHAGRDLKLIDRYPGFEQDLDETLTALTAADKKANRICDNIRNDISENKLKYRTYLQFSKWCDWSRKSEEVLAKNVSRVLFGFEIPRMWTKENKIIDDRIVENFLSQVAGSEEISEENNKPEIDSTAENEAIPDIEEEDITKEYAKYHSEGRIRFVTFHPSYSYEEFIEGITVKTEGENKPTPQVQYVLRPGLFKNMCKSALGAALGMEKEAIEDSSWNEIFTEYRDVKDSMDFKSAPRYALIIDEINRGDIAKIFGELITLLEADKRIGAANELIVKLPASGDEFGVPQNLYIVATMNTADRSIALLDVALRRRFGFIEMNPDFDVFTEDHLDKHRDEFVKNGVYGLLERSRDAILGINKAICKDTTIGRDRQIGHSFLFKVFNVSELMLVWKHEILPLLEEYCYSNYAKINKILFGKERDTEWITESGGVRDINEQNLNIMLDQILKTER
jgi:hypothetical protein